VRDDDRTGLEDRRQLSEWPVHIEPLDRAILDLLCSIPATWGDYDAETLTGSEEEAVSPDHA
jgi:hypothetical protein